ncbi:two-component system, sensor histidine kinase YesM [Paenibacillus sophorae]|uniref:histidine kinase n=1 Tax=Paenibacillus sophorae TaxID=1333845 RepID=A0A1H8JHG4_9BACL|nr:sensor histidine kinase [Paenibacillus sophorae]QWU13354.1 sensor histidine kinase [Paenibacillus sophorae]SEN79736.1 two-component system, sensor histidine kinase YesM [Paenibacillus sophorae]
MYKWKRYRYWSIKKKLLFFSVLFILGSVFLASILSYSKYTMDFKQQSSEQVQQIIAQVSYNIDTYLDDLFRLTLSPYMNDGVMQTLEEDVHDSHLAQLKKRRFIDNYLEEMMIYPRKDINRVFILTDEMYTVGRMPISVDYDSRFQEFDWYKQAMNTQDSIFVPTHTQQMVKNGGPKVFSIVKQLRSTRDTEKILGAIKVDANYNGIAVICSKVDMGSGGGLFILDNNRNVIYRSTDRLNAVSLFNQVKASGKPTMTINQGGTSYLLNSTQLPRSNWTIVAVSSIKELNQKATETRNFGFFIALACSLLAFILMYFFVRRFLAPLLHIVKLMREVEQGNLQVSFPAHRNDEIGYLGTSFNGLVSRVREMLGENTQLVKQVYETELLQKEAQVQALYNQIRPHFLFNTLNMISMQMQTGKQDKAIDHLHKLSSMLRSMTQMDKDIPLQKELDLLKAYLSIQSSRYEGRLEYELRVDPALYDMPIPALLFQPIVENAVIHGCEAKREQTSILISGEKTARGEVLFTIRDSGQGMSPETLLELRGKLEQAPSDNQSAGDPDSDGARTGTGIGLLNVNKRIKLKYGFGYGIKVDSVQGQGTAVSVLLPDTGFGKER